MQPLTPSVWLKQRLVTCVLQEVVLLLPRPGDVRARQAVPRGRQVQQGHDQVPRAAARHEDGVDVGADQHQAEATTRTQDAEVGTRFGFVATAVLLSPSKPCSHLRNYSKFEHIATFLTQCESLV